MGRVLSRMLLVLEFFVRDLQIFPDDVRLFYVDWLHDPVSPYHPPNQERREEK